MKKARIAAPIALRTYAALKTFFRWCTSRDPIPTDPMQGVERPFDGEMGRERSQAAGERSRASGRGIGAGDCAAALGRSWIRGASEMRAILNGSNPAIGLGPPPNGSRQQDMLYKGCCRRQRDDNSQAERRLWAAYSAASATWSAVSTASSRTSDSGSFVSLPAD